MSTTRLPFSEVHRRAREALGLTQTEAAARIKVSLRTIQNWEGGRKQPQLPQLVRAASLYGWDLPFLRPAPHPAKTPRRTSRRRVIGEYPTPRVVAHPRSNQGASPLLAVA